MVAIVGAGASGLAAAITLAQEGIDIVLIEKQSKIGRKILASGNGKCNIANSSISKQNYHSSSNKATVGRFLLGCSYESIKDFFETLGLKLIDMPDSKAYPMSQRGSSVVNLLDFHLKHSGVKLELQSDIEEITPDRRGFTLYSKSGKSYSCKELILACGSAAAEHLGGSTAPYRCAKMLKHSIVEPHPSLVPLCSSKKWIRDCAGIKVESRVRLICNKREVSSREGDLLFTKYGVSGLAILDISYEASKYLNSGSKVELSIDIVPKFSKEYLLKNMNRFANRCDSLPVELWLGGYIHPKLAEVVLKISKTDLSSMSRINRKGINKIVYTMKNLKIAIDSTREFRYAEVASGGVALDEVDPASMESKIHKGLYITGEMLDIVGDRGGYNLHFAWCSGIKAARAIVKNRSRR